MPEVVVEVKSGNEVILSATVGNDKKWSGTVTTALTAEEEYTITATQKIGSVVSTASTAVKFTTVSA